MAGGVGDTQQVSQSTEHLGPIPRAARIVNENLMAEKRYPDLDTIVSQGQSSEYDLTQGAAWAPFKKVNTHHIPDAIFEQYNQAQCHTMMGLFTEIGYAWMTVDNRLYMWEYATGNGFQGYEAQPNTITAARLLKPRPDVFNEKINYVLMIGTSVEVILLGISAILNNRNAHDIAIYDTKMSINTKGLDISVIEGSKNGRIFFGGRSDNEIYEFTYKGQEGWFYGRCAKICHTSQGITSFTPKIALSFLAGAKDTEYLVDMVVDDSRSLLYTLSSKSNIRAFHMSQDNVLVPRITYSWPQIRSSVGVLVGESRLIQPNSTIVAISPMPVEVGRRTHLIATTSTGCRLFMSAASSDYVYETASSMQVVHIRFPPLPTNAHNLREIPINQSPALTPTRRARIIPPGYFFCIVESQDRDGDSLFISAPDTAKLALLADQGHSRLQLCENSSFLNLESRAEAIEVVCPPPLFGNEASVQFDTPPAEFAILTNTGVQIIKRRRLVEIFSAAIRYGAHGPDAEVRKFFDTYGRAEGCFTALAVACGVNTEAPENRGGRITDQEVCDLARKFYIDFGGKPRAESTYDGANVTTLDNVRLSGRHEGLALYVSRVVRSIWREPIIKENKTPGGITTHKSIISTAALEAVQEQLQRLAKFLLDNKSFIEGLSAPTSMSVVQNRMEELALVAEHKGMHSLQQLTAGIIEGISFVLVLFEHPVDEIIMGLTEEHRAYVKKITYEELFTSSTGLELAKELVQGIVNKSIASGGDVDSITTALRRRCGSFCSADDVIVFKAIEHMKKARDETDLDLKMTLLRESLRLFEETASSLSMDNLRETVSEFIYCGFYQGAVLLPLTVAKAIDNGTDPSMYGKDGAPENAPQAEVNKKKKMCYQLIFEALDRVDDAARWELEAQGGQPSFQTQLRVDTWDLVYRSDDEQFQNELYDWLCSRGQGHKLLEINSPFVLDYLKRKAAENLGHAELLWQWYAKREDYFSAAQVLYKLVRGDFDLTLEQRLEYLSRARGFCSSQAPAGTRQRMTDLSHSIQEELDVAVIQDELVKRIRDDVRISESKKEALIVGINKQLIGLTELYNNYAEKYEYMDICLAIFQSADYRGPLEIRKCWETLITQTHERAVEDGRLPWEAVSEIVRRLGHRFSLSEYIFPPTELVPLLETYALTKQRNIGPRTWVIESLLDAGVPHDVLLRILDDMFWRNEEPFQGNTRKTLVLDAVWVADKWYSESLKGRSYAGGRTAMGAGFKPEGVVQILEAYLKSGVDLGPETEAVERLASDIRRRFMI
ncbi:Non-repetitive/WGA-negative nucleoporin C-terminal-domain-containing protein [Terfezia claveryi]|nr:Non-repetitive/WGA-negative nucleoporin C-terminal-domain-containing protein [Terfezia claveryi]